MNKLLMVLMVVAVACTRDKVDEASKVSGGTTDVTAIASDAGITWRVDRLVFKYARLGSIYTWYLPDYNTSVFEFSSQRISFKKQTPYSGAFGVTDSLSQLMNIPTSGKYYVEEMKNKTVLKLRLEDGGGKSWLGFKQTPNDNLIEGWRSYQINDTDYHVEYRLVSLMAPR